MRVALIVASLGRAEELGQLLAQLAKQVHKPAKIILSVESEADLPSNLGSEGMVVYGARGSSAQRNRGLSLLSDSDIVAFFDDDYLPSIYALRGISELFEKYPDIVGATGHLLADGNGKREISHDDALNRLSTFDLSFPHNWRIKRNLYGCYGCNMAFRVSAIGNSRFDERLPLYGWQEDVDFAAQFLPHGRLVETDAFVGIHRGVRHGRVPSKMLGFSQMVNPIYLMRKGTMRPSHGLSLMAKNFLANHINCLRPRYARDRIGRVAGNWLGILHIFSGKADPETVVTLK